MSSYFTAGCFICCSGLAGSAKKQGFYYSDLQARNCRTPKFHRTVRKIISSANCCPSEPARQAGLRSSRTNQDSHRSGTPRNHCILFYFQH